MTKSSTLLLLFSLFLFSHFASYAQPADSTKVEKTEISETVEEMPIYSGGEMELFKFLSENVAYPEEAILKGISGLVYVSFVVMEDGSIKNAKVVRDIGGGCGEEALRVVKLMPKWTPGKQDGEPVSIQYNLPIRFYLSRSQLKKAKKRNRKLNKPQINKPQYK